MNDNNFFRCEFKFFKYLFLGLLLLNMIAIVFQYLFNVGLFISMIISVIIIFIYIFYFIYLFIKVKVFNKKYNCQDIKQRLSSWLSSSI